MMLSSDNQYKIYSRILCLLRLQFVLGMLEINKVGLNKSLQRCKYTVSGSLSSWGKRPGSTSNLDILAFLKGVIASILLQFSQVLRGKRGFNMAVPQLKITGLWENKHTHWI